MLKEPPFPEHEWEGVVELCTDGDTLFAKFDTLALSSFQWNLWWLAAKCPPGEDISIEATRTASCAAGRDEIAYSEITMTGEGPITDTTRDRRAQLLYRGKRIDLFVDRSQAIEAFHQLEALNGEASSQQVTLFGRVIVRIMEARLDTT